MKGYIFIATFYIIFRLSDSKATFGGIVIFLGQ